jgi:hypothetical protein
MRAWYAILVASMLILAACGGPSSTSSTQRAQQAQPAVTPVAAALDPCSVITKADVEQIVGKTVAEGKLNSMNKAICEFNIGEMGSSISFMLVPRSPEDTAERMVAEMNKRKIHAEVVPGLADGAYRADTFGMKQAGAYKGSKHVIVTIAVPGMAPAQAQAIVDQALRKALERM